MTDRTSRRPVARRLLVALLGLVVVAGGVSLSAQRGRGRFYQPEPSKLPYDGRFTFARIRFEQSTDVWDQKWAHDYPRGEANFMQILREITSLRPTMNGGTVLTLDDPDLFKFPIAYLCEPGFWEPTDVEVTALRTYLQKGGFIIFDDFAANHWYNFEAQMRKVLPDARPVRLDTSHPIFDSFFRITTLEYAHPNYGMRSEFLGIYEDNDPSKRLVAIINYNNDIGDYWEFSDEGRFPVDLSNTAYKLGVNYVMYAMTH